jgi:antirestriction protein ArdC
MVATLGVATLGVATLGVATLMVADMMFAASWVVVNFADQIEIFSGAVESTKIQGEK